MEILENNLFKGEEIDVCCPIDGNKLIHDENYSQFGKEYYSCKTCGALYISLNEKDLIREAIEYLKILKE